MSSQMLIDLYTAALTGVLSSHKGMDKTEAAHTAMQHAIEGRKKLYDHLKGEEPNLYP